MYNRIFFLQIADQLKKKYLWELLREIKKRLTSIEKKNKLVLLTKKLNEIEVEKVASLLDS